MRELLASSLVQTRTRKKASRPAAARWTGKDAGTIKNWEKAKTAITLEDVLTSETLGEDFLEKALEDLRAYDAAQWASAGRKRRSRG
ncbi:MAG TPA: hypothetical protein VJN18_32445 [Polyangiaceae bacterium]|nr:hypothetical protein [Polyangiaceae bacterium]